MFAVDFLLTLLVTALVAFTASGLGVLATAWFLRNRAPSVRLDPVVNAEGKHYHHFDRTAQPPQKPGYYCECGWRAPERLQPKQWRVNRHE